LAKILLIHATYALELDEATDLLGSDDEILLLASQLEKDIESGGQVFGWVSSRYEPVDTSINNIGKCANCNALTSDCESEEAVTAVSPGALVGGRLLCDVCLPKGHPLAF